MLLRALCLLLAAHPGHPGCASPPWPSPEDAATAAEAAESLIAAGRALEAVRRLRRALSPLVLDRPERYWAADHVALRGALGRALLASAPPQPAAAMAQFVASARIREGADPLHAFERDSDAPSGNERHADGAPGPPAGGALQLGRGLLQRAGLAPPPPAHKRSIFELPRRQGDIEVLPRAPTARELAERWAQGSTTGFGSAGCAAAVERNCGAALGACDAGCMERCCARAAARRDVEDECLQRGAGRPFVVRGAADHWHASKVRDNPEWLVREYGTLGLGGEGPPSRVEIEEGKKETRMGVQPEGERSLSEFISREMANESDWYSVTTPPGVLLEDAELPPFLSCGGFTDHLVSALMWMSSGGTKSVVHADDSDNFNCLLSGTKRMMFWHPRYRRMIESPELGWVRLPPPFWLSRL